MVYYGDNSALWSDACADYHYDRKICGHLLLVRNTEIACTVSKVA